MATEFCPECHQPLGDTVHGVRMPIFKIKLFRHIESHPGQSAEELAQTFGKNAHAIRSHVNQINDLMLLSDRYITGGKKMGYVVMKSGNGKRL
jgi:hypothetical protein